MLYTSSVFGRPELFVSCWQPATTATLKEDSVKTNQACANWWSSQLGQNLKYFQKSNLTPPLTIRTMKRKIKALFCSEPLFCWADHPSMPCMCPRGDDTPTTPIWENWVKKFVSFWAEWKGKSLQWDETTVCLFHSAQHLRVTTKGNRKQNPFLL